MRRIHTTAGHREACHLQVEGNMTHCLGSVRAQTALQSALAAAVPNMLSVQLLGVTAVPDHTGVLIASFAVATAHPPGALPAQARSQCMCLLPLPSATAPKDSPCTICG